MHCQTWHVQKRLESIGDINSAMRKDEILRTIEGDGAPVVVFRRGDYLGLRMAENAHLIQGYRHRFRPLDFRAEYLEGHLAASMMFTA